jgi:prepilin peptidase CpaA
MESLHFFLVAGVATTAIGAWTDVRSGHIPNWLTMATLGWVTVAHAILSWLSTRSLGSALAALFSALGGAVACGAIPLLLYRRGGMGGGDVKLFAAIGAAWYALLGMRAELNSFAFGGVYALGLMLYRGTADHVFRKLPSLAGRGASSVEPRETDGATTSLRFGPAIFVGTVATAFFEWSHP